MITISGQMDMCNGLMVTYIKGGATQLTIAVCAASQHEMDGVMYRLVWIGADAEDFYHQHGEGLRSGKRLTVTGTNPRALIDRGEPVIMLDVLGIEILERGAGEVGKTLAPCKPEAQTTALNVQPGRR